jgi:hypothetical protein
MSLPATASHDNSGLCCCCCCCCCCGLHPEPFLQALVSVSVIGTQDSMSDEQLTAAVVKELSAWFGPDQTATWSHLKTYRCVSLSVAGLCHVAVWSGSCGSILACRVYLAGWQPECFWCTGHCSAAHQQQPAQQNCYSCPVMSPSLLCKPASHACCVGLNAAGFHLRSPTRAPPPTSAAPCPLAASCTCVGTTETAQHSMLP